MLDYISRANEIKICRSCLSVHHPSLALSLNLSHGFLPSILFYFLVALGHIPRFFFFIIFEFLKKKKTCVFFFF